MSPSALRSVTAVSSAPRSTCEHAFYTLGNESRTYRMPSFAERDPTVNPSTNQSTAPTVWGRDCPNPPSMTSFKCTLWGSSIDSDDATNQGQYREEFDVVITASGEISPRLLFGNQS